MIFLIQNIAKLVMNHKMFYHLSEECHDMETFVPKKMDRNRVMEHENWWTKRICVSDSIDGAISALMTYDTTPFGKHLFVHVPENIDDLMSRNKIVKPTLKQVPDADATGEHWLKAPTKMKCIGELEILNMADEQIEFDHHGSKSFVDKFVWKWVWQS